MERKVKCLISAPLVSPNGTVDKSLQTCLKHNVVIFNQNHPSPQETCHSHEITAISKFQQSNQFHIDKIQSRPTFFPLSFEMHLYMSYQGRKVNRNFCFMSTSSWDKKSIFTLIKLHTSPLSSLWVIKSGLLYLVECTMYLLCIQSKQKKRSKLCRLCPALLLN